jgi:hypothetical protein
MRQAMRTRTREGRCEKPERTDVAGLNYLDSETNSGTVYATNCGTINDKRRMYQYPKTEEYW